MGIEMIAPHRRGRKRPKAQDGRWLRRYKRRYKVERLFAWLGNFHRLVVRYEHYEHYALNFLGFVQLGCIFILLCHGRAPWRATGSRGAASTQRADT